MKLDILKLIAALVCLVAAIIFAALTRVAVKDGDAVKAAQGGVHTGYYFGAAWFLLLAALD